jgi:hypothetical protein
MPQGPDPGDPQTGSIARWIERVPGGQVILMQPDVTDPAWQLIAVDDDGSIRWRRCGSAEVWGMYAGADGDVVHVREAEYGEWWAWRSFDLVSGADAPPLGVPASLADARFADATDRYAVFGDALTLADLRLVDLDSGAITVLPDPGIGGTDGASHPVELIEREDGTPVLAIGEQFATLAVYVGGEWRTDHDTLLAERGLAVVETRADPGNAEPGNGVWARDALGDTVWFHPIVAGMSGEGWATGVVSDVVLTNECRRVDAADPFSCTEPWHIALDLATGELLWEGPGFISVGPAGDGAVMITGEGGWTLVDVRTGEVLQEYDDSFGTECCGLGTFVWTGHDGGVVWAVDQATIRIFYPELVSQPTVEVDLRS